MQFMFVKFSSFKMIQVSWSVYTSPAVGTGGRRTEDVSCDTSHLWYMRCQTWSSVALERAELGIPRVHHTDILLAASMHGHTCSSACHACMLLNCGGGTALCGSVIKPHFRCQCDFSSTAADSCIAVARQSLSLPVMSVRVPIESWEICFPPGKFVSRLGNPGN